MAQKPTVNRRVRSVIPSSVSQRLRRLYRPARPPAKARRKNDPSTRPCMRPQSSRFDSSMHTSQWFAVILRHAGLSEHPGLHRSRRAGKPHAQRKMVETLVAGTLLLIKPDRDAILKALE